MIPGPHSDQSEGVGKPVGLTVDDAQDAFKQHQLEAQQSLARTLAVKTDSKTGKSYFFGIEVSRNMAFLLNQGVINLRPLLNKKGSEFFYENTAYFLEKTFKKSTEASHHGGLRAAKGFSIALIAAEPVANLLHVYSQYSEEKSVLLKDFAPVIAASKGSYKDNEVLQTELKRIHDDVKKGLWLTAADIPYLIPTTTSAMHDHADLAKRRGSDLAGKQKLSEGASARLQEKMTRMQESAAAEMESRQQLGVMRDAFFAKNKGVINPYTKKPYSDKELEKTWKDLEYDIVNEQRYERQAAISAKYGSHKDKSSDKEEDDKHEASKQKIIFATGLASAFIKDKIEGDEANKPHNTTAGQMILQLKKSVEEQSAVSGKDEYGDVRTPSAGDITIDFTNGNDHRTLGLREFIVEVFQQNERDHGRTVIGAALMPKLQPAVDQIADVIADGRLDPLALVNLVGDHKIIKRTENGTRSFVSDEAMKPLIEEQLAILSSREEQKSEDLFADFANPKKAKEDVESNLKLLPHLEKAFFISLFPMETLKKISGMKEKDIIAARKEIHSQLFDIYASSVLYLADKDAKEFERLGIAEDARSAIVELADKIKGGDEQALNLAVDNHRNNAITKAIRTAGLNEGPKFWTDRVNGAKKAHDILLAGKANADSATAREDTRRENPPEIAPGGPT